MRLARDDAAVFTRLVLKDELNGERILSTPMHGDWHDLAGQHDRLVLMSHVESGKTQQLSVGRVLWELGRDPNTRVAVVSNTAGQAVKITRAKFEQLCEDLFTRCRGPVLRCLEDHLAGQRHALGLLHHLF